MKSRMGFVSNSSSSSFIVAFPKHMPVTEDAVGALLFGKYEKNDMIEYCGYRVHIDDAVAKIVAELQAQTPNDIDKLQDACDGYLDGAPSYEAFKSPKQWNAYVAACDKYRIEFYNAFMAANSGADVYSFEFSDGDGALYCVLEHGDVFDNLPHEKISRH